MNPGQLTRGSRFLRPLQQPGNPQAALKAGNILAAVKRSGKKY